MSGLDGVAARIRGEPRALHVNALGSAHRAARECQEQPPVVRCRGRAQLIATGRHGSKLAHHPPGCHRERLELRVPTTRARRNQGHECAGSRAHGSTDHPRQGGSSGCGSRHATGSDHDHREHAGHEDSSRHLRRLRRDPTPRHTPHLNPATVGGSMTTNGFECLRGAGGRIPQRVGLSGLGDRLSRRFVRELSKQVRHGLQRGTVPVDGVDPPEVSRIVVPDHRRAGGLPDQHPQR